MAVLPYGPCLAVNIVVNVRALQGYRDTESSGDPPNTVTKYIEAESGVEFSIRYIAYDRLPSPNFAVYIYLACKEVSSSLHQQHDFIVHRFYSEEGVYSKLGLQTVCQHFRFSDMVVDECLPFKTFDRAAADNRMRQWKTT